MDSPIPAPPVASTPAVRRTMQGNRKTDTRPELWLRSELHRRGFRFRKNHPLRPDGGRPIRPDIVFTRARVVIFVDGCFWHRCPQHGNSPRANGAYWGPKLDGNVARDRKTDSRLSEAGWTVVRVWEHEGTAEAADRVQRVVAHARSRVSR